MDAFKNAEVKRMELGGNKPWKDFFNNHSSNKLTGQDFDACTISERYDSEAGEEWKDRLTAKVEGTEYVPGSSKKPAPKKATVESDEPTPVGSGRNTPLQNVRSPPQRTASPSQKARNEAYFASKGAENASRPDNLPPSQGGKYGGFGSEPPPTSNPNQGGIPTGDEFQKDPMAALTKGFGWLSSTVSKQAATLNSSYIQPGMKSIESGEFASQARQAAMQAGTYMQQGAKGATDQFNRFVDPDYAGQPGGGRRTVEPERKDFWDDFAAAGEAASQRSPPKPTSIGTSAMKTNSSGGAAAGKKDDDEWGAW
jgi:ADP-ribosylation factor GTPase-activating protein 1